MMLRVLTTLFVLLISTSAFAQVAPFPNAAPLSSFPQEHSKQIALLLNHYHEIPAKALFEETPQAQQIVVAFAMRDGDWIQDRALTALAKYWVTADLYLKLAEVVTNKDTRFGVRIRLMQTFADTYGERAIPALKGYLKHPELQFRLSAIQAIGTTQSDRGFEILEEFAKSERSEIELQTIKKFGSRIQ